MSYDIEHFKELVRDNPFLYDLSDEDYKNRQKRQMLGRKLPKKWVKKIVKVLTYRSFTSKYIFIC